MKILAGKILASLRKERRMTQQYIGDYLSVSRPTYERYEKDMVEIPLSKLCALAHLYKINPIELLSIVIETPSRLKISYSCATDLTINTSLKINYLLA